MGGGFHGVGMARCGLPAWSLAGLLLALCGHPIPGPRADAFEVRLSGSSSEVAYGGMVLLNCSTSCPKPEKRSGLETSLSKETVGQGPGWLSVRLWNITEPLSDIVCYFSCFGERKKDTLRVLAYDLPQPRLTISSPNASLNESVAIECSAEPSRPPGRQLQLRGSRLLPQPWAEDPRPVELVAGEDDDGAEFTCEAELRLDSQTVRRSRATTTLRVMYQPRLDEESCPPWQNWTEGQEETLRCQARGNPLPQLRCDRDDGETFPTTVPHRVTRHHAGTYRCRATNELGTAERDVTVRVEYRPPAVLLPVLGGLLLALFLLAGVGGYGLHRQKRVRLHRLWPWQQQRLETEDLAPP